MAISIGSLAKVTLDFTNRGPGLKKGLDQATARIEADRRTFLHLDVVVAEGATVPIVMKTEDLYILGFKCGAVWRCFSDVTWPFSEAVKSLGYEGRYDVLGGLGGIITAEHIVGIRILLDPLKEPTWKKALLALLVVVSENLRLTPVNMWVLGVLNGFGRPLPLSDLERYIKNWKKASSGKDMSVKVGENAWTGFKDPKLIKR